MVAGAERRRLPAVARYGWRSPRPQCALPLVEIEAVDNLAFGLGLLARVHKGTVATYQRRKVNGERWLPAQVTWTASARVLLVRRLRLRGVAEFSDYRRYTVDTRIKIGESR